MSIAEQRRLTPAEYLGLYTLGISVPVAEIYANVEFPPAPTQAESLPAERRPG